MEDKKINEYIKKKIKDVADFEKIKSIFLKTYCK